MKGTKGLGFPSSRHCGRARQITSGLGIGKHSKEGSFDNWRQPGECSHINGHVLKLPPANSLLLLNMLQFSHWNHSLSSLNLREVESVPGTGAMSAGQRIPLLSTPSKAKSPSVAHFTATSGLMRTNLKFYITPSIKNQTRISVENLHLFSRW